MEQVNKDDRHDGNGDHHVNLTHVEIHVVCAPEGCDHDRQGLFVLGRNDQGSFNVVVIYETTPVLYREDGTPYADWSAKVDAKTVEGSV